jgi:hypothetical protein
MRLHDANPSKLLGDKGYDSDDIELRPKVGDGMKG